jgi:hypothetical protein
MDMTFGIIRPLPDELDKSIGNNNLVINVPRADNTGMVCINLAEYITNTANTIGFKSAIQHFCKQYEIMDPIYPKPFDQVVTDKCWASITALIEGLNNTSYEDYVEKAYEAFYDPSKSESFFEKYVITLLCGSHTCKTINHDLLGAYKKKQLTKEDYHFLCSLLGNVFEITGSEECDAYIDAVFGLLCSKQVTPGMW